jgi:hypothetical protein
LGTVNAESGGVETQSLGTVSFAVSKKTALVAGEGNVKGSVVGSSIEVTGLMLAAGVEEDSDTGLLLVSAESFAGRHSS